MVLKRLESKLFWYFLLLEHRITLGLLPKLISIFGLFLARFLKNRCGKLVATGNLRVIKAAIN